MNRVEFSNLIEDSMQKNYFNQDGMNSFFGDCNKFGVKVEDMENYLKPIHADYINKFLGLVENIFEQDSSDGFGNLINSYFFFESSGYIFHFNGGNFKLEKERE